MGRTLALEVFASMKPYTQIKSSGFLSLISRGSHYPASSPYMYTCTLFFPSASYVI